VPNPNPSSGDPVLHHSSAKGGEFRVEREGKRIAELTYSLAGADAVVSHTWVDPDHRGGTLAPSLVAAAVEWARANGRHIVARCPYVEKVFSRSPETYADVWKR